MSIILELLEFLKERKKLWLAPLILILVAMGGLMLIAKGTVVAPFIYTIF